MNKIEVMNLIIETLESGKTVMFTTYGRAIKVTPRNYKAWVKRGDQMFKATEESLYIRSGKGWDCANGCKITVH